MRDLPPGWSIASLHELAFLITDGDHNPPKRVAEGVPHLTARNVRGGRLVLDRCTFISDEDFLRTSKRYAPAAGDVIVTCVGTLGETAIVPEGLSFSADRNLAAIRPRPVILSSFLKAMLDSPQLQKALKRGSGSTAQPHLYLGELRELSIPLPPLSEQRKIVEAVDEQFSRLAAGLALLERARNNLRRMRASLYTVAVSGRLISSAGIPSTVDISRDVRLSLSLTPENSRKTKRVIEDLLGRVWGIPPTWAWKPAVEVCEVIASGSTPPQSAMTCDQGEIPYIKVYNLTQAGRLDFSVRPTFIDRVTHETTLRRSRLFPGDILMNIVGPPLGKVSVVPGDYPEWNTNQAVVIFRPIKSLHPSLLKYWLLSPPVIKLIESTAKATAGQRNVSLTTCRALPFPIPPRDDQDMIVASIEDRVSMIDSQEELIKTSISRTVSLRSAILSAAFSGKLI